MTLWNIIRDWFVVHVWGGVDSSNTLYNTNMINGTSNTSDNLFTIGNLNISVGDWLSTTCTILVLGAMCLFLFIVVRYLFRLCSGLIRGH